MLNRPVTALPGIGEKKAKTLKGLGLETVRDVLFSFPRTYKDFQQVLEPHEGPGRRGAIAARVLLHLRSVPFPRDGA